MHLVLELWLVLLTLKAIPVSSDSCVAQSVAILLSSYSRAQLFFVARVIKELATVNNYNALGLVPVRLPRVDILDLLRHPF